MAMTSTIRRATVCAGSGCFAPVADVVAGADARCRFSCVKCCRVIRSTRRFSGGCCKSYPAGRRCSRWWKGCQNYRWRWKAFAVRADDCDGGWMRCARCCAERRPRRRVISACRCIKPSNICKRSSRKAPACLQTINIGSASRSWAEKTGSLAQMHPL